MMHTAATQSKSASKTTTTTRTTMRSLTRRAFLAGAVLLLPLVISTDGAALQDAEPIKVLIVTGEDVPAHDWKSTTPVTRELLESDKRFDVRVCEDIGILESKAIDRYDVLVFNFRNNFRVRDVSEAARDNVVAYLESGKGLVALHFAVAALQNWPKYTDLIGRVWIPRKSGHGPRGPFNAKVADAKHAVTHGVEDFAIDDELYAKLEGDAPIHVLVTADSEWSGATEPLVWTRELGRGRVVCNVLGHDAAARRTPAFGALLRNGVAWAAGKTGE